MIFVTVGTHEQAFDRLIKYMDMWADEHDEEVIMQTGFTGFVPEHCKWQKFYNYDQMTKYMNDARIVITHGGPSSFITALQLGKLPIVVPRRADLGEHVNDHQVIFCTELERLQRNIVVVNEIKELGGILERFSEISAMKVQNIKSHNADFCKAFEVIISELMG